MRILFLCGSLEPGKDGVGDYTRRLNGELMRRGHYTSIISLNDKFVSNIEKSFQKDEEKFIPVLRIPSSLKNKVRYAKAKKYIDEQDPEWLSLQFVLFSYCRKGIPFGIEKYFQRIGAGRKWHIMFHELWLGASSFDSPKTKVWGFMQKLIIKNLIRNVEPKKIFTNTSFYQNNLSTIGVIAKLTPVFSNLPLGNPEGKTIFNLLPKHVLENRSDYIIGTFFGKLNYNDYINIKIEKLASLIPHRNRLLITHIGKKEFLLKPFRYEKGFNRIEMLALGEHPSQDIADYFQHVDFGLSTYPKILYEKSGSIAAMLHNGLPVLLLNNNLIMDNRPLDGIELLERVELDQFLYQSKIDQQKYSVKENINAYEEIFS